MQLLLGVLLLAWLPGTIAAQQEHYDLIIRNGRIIDGTGSPWYSGEIGIREGRIAQIRSRIQGEARRTIDAAGMVVTPGFIDMLGQSDLTILVSPQLPSKIFQGITTEFTGEGGSVAPLNDRIIASDRLGYERLKITPDWRTMGEYFARLERQGIGINVGHYVGATQVRRMVLGDDDRQPTGRQLEQMQKLVGDAMRDGAAGLSTSLQYPPAPYAQTDELIALAREAARHGGVYATHMRSESNEILSALAEAIRIGREARIPVEIWHLKVAGKQNWGRMPEVIAVIDSARRTGVDIAADTYAYPAWFNSLSAMVPPWAHDG
ncbi:MAG TPA: amidohydrolase family protein, partial [Gemmatimonadales bacterium]|nr:amidohydrolase family protein [Gemmatimonadales bacterium]